MKVVLAEKPSVARDIAAVLGANVKKEGYFEGNDYAVTYAFGHLVTIAEPEDMDPKWGKPWRMEQLPMLPSSWKYRIADKAGPQFKVIKNLFLDPKTESIICATDAGREGEHIFRLIYMLSGSAKPVQRLWISSLTAESIRDGFKKLKPSKDFDNLADAASARAHADWIVGLNFTRAYTSINRQLCTIGRVQTPTLSLIVERQKLIDSFTSAVFYELKATFEPGFSAKYISSEKDPQTRMNDKAAAEKILLECKDLKAGLIKSVTSVEKRIKAPALFDLLTLQKEANRRWSYTAQETLDIAQSLYETHKLISYPRTESRHLSEDMVQELPGVLIAALKSSFLSKEVLDAFSNEQLTPKTIDAATIRARLGKTYIDDAKLTDHHAIIPTGKVATGKLPPREQNIFELITRRFLAIFLPAEIKEETTAIISLADHLFRAKGVVVKDPGWTVVEPSAKQEEPAKEPEKGKGKSKAKEKDKEKDAEETQELPPLSKDQQVAKKSIELKEGKTTPPKPYDDASLLSAMKTAGQQIDDEDLAAYMKSSGLGTPATRAAIIERLLQTGYIERSKKYLIPTDKGKALITHVHSNLKDIALTATWEQRLKDMQDGKMESSNFETDIGEFVCTLIGDLSSKPNLMPAVPTDPKSVGGFATCPMCKTGAVRLTPKGAGCSAWREGCKFSVWGEVAGKKLSDNQLKEIVENGRSKLIKGFKRKDGSGTFDAFLVLSNEFKVRFEFPAPSDTPSDSGADESGTGGKTAKEKSEKSGAVKNKKADSAAASDSEAKEDKPAKSAKPLNCPKCKSGNIINGKRGIGCGRWKEGCTFAVFQEQYGKKLSELQLRELVSKGKTKLIKGFEKPDGSGTYDAKLILDGDFKVALEI